LVDMPRSIRVLQDRLMEIPFINLTAKRLPRIKSNVGAYILG
jgi:hypothetical protein